MTIIQTTAVNIRPDSEPMFSKQAITVGIYDKGAGQYIVIMQDGQCIKIDGREWPVVRGVINRMVKTCLG